ncbi:MAG: hypothetical protein JWM02_2216 [Frankiales bacterium]|nr:hypothetical protein [Frankiales bacterium]
MDAVEVLRDAYGRIAELVHGVVRGRSDDELAHRPDPEANSPAWLLWHQSRVQDDHLAAAFGVEQVWTADGWAARFELPFSPSETGFGMSAEDVGKVRAGAELLGGYHAAVHAQTVRLLQGDLDLDRVVDDSYDPPVTLGARLLSVVGDELQHVGQAAYVLGLRR